MRAEPHPPLVSSTCILSHTHNVMPFDTVTAECVSEVLRFYRWLRFHRKEAALIFLSGRRDSETEATNRNLKHHGYVGYSRLIMREVADQDKNMAGYKHAQRLKLEEEGFTIVASVGDQWSDFAGGSTGYKLKLPNYLYTLE